MPNVSDLESFTKPTIGDRSILWLKNYYNRKFEGESWIEFEPEFLLLELSADYAELPMNAIRKVALLYALESDQGERFYTDPLFASYAVEVMNNTCMDMDEVPSLTSLELVYAVNLIRTMYPKPITTALKELCIYALREEGFTFAPTQFEFVPDDALAETVDKKDEIKKQRALTLYLKLMEKVDK